MTNEKCQKCGKPGVRRRQNISYVDDESNFAVLCPECQDEADEYWRDMWNEYYNAII